MARKVIKQNDLRRLMRERSEGLIKNEKIESPLAKYDSLGKLSCIACSIEITSKVPWRQHILTKSHKENVSKRLKKKSSESSLPIPASFAIPKDVISKGDSPAANDSKRLKLEPSSANLIQGYSSSEEEEEDNQQNGNVSNSITVSPSSTSVLPPDFFDAPTSTESTLATEEKSDTKNTQAPVSNVIPEGFFDDPVLDAKARNVEYKDPKEEEWEKFQKIIAEETTVSQNIIEEDAVESEVNKNIEQIDEQIYKWHQVNNLLSKREEMLQKKPVPDSSEPQESTGSSATEEENEDIDELLDWRAKSWKT